MIYVLPAQDIKSQLSSTMLHFLDGYEIGVKGILTEVIRLVTLWRRRLTPGDVEQYTDVRHVAAKWHEVQGSFFPHFTEREAVDLYRHLVNLFYQPLYDSFLHIFTNVQVYDRADPTVPRLVNATGAIIKRYKGLDDSLIVDLDIDYLGF